MGYEFYETTIDPQLTLRIQQAKKDPHCEMIIAAGGDGTVSEVANDLAGGDVPLGILPLGTGNLVARELGIPLDLKAACQVLTGQMPITRIDVMDVDGEIFISHVSLGLYAKIALTTTDEEKQRWGRMAYLWHILEELLKRRNWRFSLTVDGKTQSVRAALIMAANVGEVGLPPLRWGPDIRPTDGVINLCILRARNLRDYIMLLWHAVRGRPAAAAQTTYHRAQETITIRTRKRLPVRGDGEIIGQSAVAICIRPQHLPIIVPIRNYRRRIPPSLGEVSRPISSRAPDEKS
jgi:YegS/Rv2252/BmrU family lipid kinase